MKYVKRIFFLFFISLFLISTVNISIQAATDKISINTTKKTLYINDTYTLKVSGTKQYVLWKSSNKKVATVSKKGKVTAKSAGSCTITAIIGSGENPIRLTCKIKVKSRLSCEKTFIRCYPDEYELARIETKKLLKDETLIYIENSNEKVISVEWDEESEYHDIIFIPETLGKTQIQIKIASIKDWEYFDFDIKDNDVLTFTIISYPDRLGWISESDIANYGFHFLKDSKTLLYSKKNSLSGMADSYNFDPETDQQNEDNTYTSDQITYKIEDEKFYFSTESIENLLFNTK